MTAGDGFITGSTQVALQPVTFQPIYTQSNPYQVVVINGSSYIPQEVEITEKAHGATDSCTITLPIGSNIDFSADLFRGSQPLMPGSVFNIDNSNEPVFVEVWQGFPSTPAAQGSTSLDGLTRTYFGTIDMYSARFHDDLVTFTCGSLAKPLITDRLTRISMNETSIQFAQQCATYAGLNLIHNLIYPPITVQETLARELVGGYSFAASLYGKHYWDMLLDMAIMDDVDVWVDQNNLFYAAPSQITRTTIPLVYGRDFKIEEGVTGTHSIQYNKNIKIIIHSYTRRTRATFTVHLTSDGFGGYNLTTSSSVGGSQPNFGTNTITTQNFKSNGSSSTSTTQVSGGSYTGNNSVAQDSGQEKYVEWAYGLEPAKINNMAKALWRQLSQHEYQIDINMPMTADFFSKFDRTAVLSLSGLPYKYFNSGTLPNTPGYYPRQITSTFSVANGWSIKMTCVNHLLPLGAP